MIGRPRCREWTPLATQQLRLRSLIQIVGYNIRPPEFCTSSCTFYITLHQTTMSAPFYTSEKIASTHPKWKEIDSEITQRMSSTNVVVRIWCHELTTIENPRDYVIQTYGVYFSGLRYIGANLSLNFTSECFKSNTLVFQMHGGYFCSYKSLKLDIIPPENEIEHGSSSDSSINPEIKFLQRNILKESRSVSPSKHPKLEREYSKSQSPIDRGFKQTFPTLKSSSSLNMKKDKPSEIYEHSPETSECTVDSDKWKNIDTSETAENYDLRSENDWVPKYRYLAISFLKSEIRPSYSVSKLQRLHLLQYAIKKKQESMQDIKERINMKSAVSNVDSNTYDVKHKFKSRSKLSLFSESLDKVKSTSLSDLSKNGKVEAKRVPNGPRLTLKLNDLLLKAKPSPHQRAEHVRLTKQLEILRFKRIILSDERDTKLVNIRRLKERYAKLNEENQDVGTELMQNYHALSRRADLMREARDSCNALRELAARCHAALASRRVELLNDLANIFHIEQVDNKTWQICSVPLPVCCDDNSRVASPSRDSVAAGLTAQAVVLTASLLGMPLRYNIVLNGSASKIVDIANELPDPNVPLYARGGDPSLYRYAMFLLNKCIAQLLWARGQHVADMRPTLANLKTLMTIQNNVLDTSKLFGTYKWLTDSDCPRTQSLRSLVASERGKQGRQFNRFKDAVDGHSPAAIMSLQKHRLSRSVGCPEDVEIPFDASSTSLMGSEPSIYDKKLPQSTVKHNSDTQLDTVGQEKVIFTLGDDDISVPNEQLEERLVRLSIHEGDVTRICEEINEFCMKGDSVAKLTAENLAKLEKEARCERLQIEPNDDSS